MPTLFLLMLFFALGCDYRIPLHGSYEIVRLSADTFVIQGGGAIVVGPTVDAYAVSPSMITGHVGEVLRHPDRTAITGYFVILIESGDIYQGLDVNEWRVLLKSLGVAELPEIRRPNRLHKLF